MHTNSISIHKNQRFVPSLEATNVERGEVTSEIRLITRSVCNHSESITVSVPASEHQLD